MSTEELGTMMKTMVSDLARAGLLKDPERAGHIVADAIIAADAPADRAGASKVDAKGATPPADAPKVAA